MKDDFNLFLEKLKNAGIKISRDYFELDISDGDESICRERVYCYELYHQLRCELGNDFLYKLYGEMDKKGHPIIRRGVKPDFILHIPGKMKNLAVIEVKPIKTDLRKLEKDLEKLKEFIEEYDYHKGIMLIYGKEANGAFERIKNKLMDFDKKDILLLWHKESEEKPEIIKYQIDTSLNTG